MADVKDLKATVPTRSSEGADEIETFLAPSAAELEKRRAAAGVADGIDAGRVRLTDVGSSHAIHISAPGPVGVSPSSGGGAVPDARTIERLIYIQTPNGLLLGVQHGKPSDIDLLARRTVADPASHAYYGRLFGPRAGFVETQVRGIQAATARNLDRQLTPLGALLVLSATAFAKDPSVRAGIEKAIAENRTDLRKSGLTPTEISSLQRAATRQASAGAKGWEKDARRIQNEIAQETAAGSTGLDSSGPALAKTERQRGDAFAISGDTSAEADHHRRLVEDAASLASADRKAAANRQAEGRARAGSNPDLARGAVRLSDLG